MSPRSKCNARRHNEEACLSTVRCASMEPDDAHDQDTTHTPIAKFRTQPHPNHRHPTTEIRPRDGSNPSKVVPSSLGAKKQTIDRGNAIVTIEYRTIRATERLSDEFPTLFARFWVIEGSPERRRKFTGKSPADGRSAAGVADDRPWGH